MTPADFCATPPNPGIVRKHGSNGAFVSRWIIDQQTLKVLKGEDLTRSTDKVHLWDPLNGEYEPIGRTIQWRRLCSADLPRRSALFDSISGLGTPDRIFFDGEEVTEADSARAWARIITGTACRRDLATATVRPDVIRKRRGLPPFRGKNRGASYRRW